MHLSLSMMLGRPTPSAGGGVLPSLYEGIVATGARMMNGLAAAGQSNSRSPHFARDDITSLKVILPNWYCPTGGTRAETGTGAAMTVTASIEYPEGVFTQVTFGDGKTSHSIPDGGSVVSDSVPVSIPLDALFWVRSWQNNAVALPVCVSSQALGAGAERATTIADKTMGGSLANSSNIYLPSAIIAQTRRVSCLVIGDSKTKGYLQTFNAAGETGDVSRWIGPHFGYSQMAVEGDRAEWLIASHVQRAALMAYASHVICDFGSNDIYSGGASSAAVLSRLATIWDYASAAGASAYQCTIPTRTTSTDSWATLENQTVDVRNDVRITVNSSFRSGLTGLDGYFELADQMESARESGKWAVTGAANYATSDGTHPSNAICEVAKSALLPVSAMLTREAA